MTFSSFLLTLFLVFVYSVLANSEFKLSNKCMKNSELCTNEELDYKAISDLHNQMDDDKNGDIDISESKDFVKASLSNNQGSEKAKQFHRKDSHIDKQDLWNIWKSNDVYNWTSEELVQWMSNEVNLPQYSNIIMHLSLNGSYMPRLTEVDFLTDVMMIHNSIHRKKIMIKAVDTVLFGSNKNFQISKQSVIITGLLFSVVILYLMIQNFYSKRFVRSMQTRIDELSTAEDNLSELKEKLVEVEEMKTKKEYEIETLTQRHKKEIERVKWASRESLTDEAHQENNRLKEELEQARARIINLTRRSTFSSTNVELLSLILQCTKVIEEHYIKEKEAVIDQECAKFKDSNERLKKRKTGLLGAITLAHSSDIYDVEKGFLAMKRAYEKLIQDKKDMQWRWKQIETLCSVEIPHALDEFKIRQAIKLLMSQKPNKQMVVPLLPENPFVAEKSESVATWASKNQSHPDGLSKNDLYQSQGKVDTASNDGSIENSSETTSHQNISPLSTNIFTSPSTRTEFSIKSNSSESLDSKKEEHHKSQPHINIQQDDKSQKEAKKKRHLFNRPGRSRIPSITRNSTRGSDDS